MTEKLSVRGKALKSLVDHFDDRSFDIQLKVSALGGSPTRGIGNKTYFPESSPASDAAVAKEEDFGGGDQGIYTPAPWAKTMADDWNTAVAGRAADANRVSDELYRSSVFLEGYVKTTENVDIMSGWDILDAGKDIKG